MKRVDQKKTCLFLAGSMAMSLMTAGEQIWAADQPPKTAAIGSADQPIQQAMGVLTAARPPLAIAHQGAIAATAQPAVPPVPAAAPAAPQQPTSILSLLGITQISDQLASHKEKLANTPLGQAIHNNLGEPIGKLLGLGPGVPPIDAPGNLQSPVQAIQKAAEVKKQEDEVPQKVQAIKYLASLENGCCYPGVHEALIAALEDCNEEVRYEAAKAFGVACCCPPEALKRLRQIVNERDDLGYYKERSRRVRKAAKESLQACSVLVPPPPEEPKPEAPEPEAPEPEGPRPEAPQVTTTGSARHMADRQLRDGVLILHPSRNATPMAVLQSEKSHASASHRPKAHTSDADLQASASAQPPAPDSSHDIIDGSVSWVDSRAGVVTITLPDWFLPPVGTLVQVHHKYLFGFRNSYLGDLEIIEADLGKARARPTIDLDIREVARGDEALVIIR